MGRLDRDYEDATFVLDAIRFVAEYGWAFLPLYRFNPGTGEWTHCRRDFTLPDRKWLGHIAYTQKGMIWRRARQPDKSSQGSSRSTSLPLSYQRCIQDAYKEYTATLREVGSRSFVGVPDNSATFDEATKRLRWFLLPCEAVAELRSETSNSNI
ncbi:unnamed protein product [Protopolystoma xenopodis]|uniref:Uncharacterized protein n=1 Tax=Protopolystoma xenopodis TaxID=117903 RepID=A0A3S4ZU69_9PLAT|nr:unnamed protein product [Protopolystoma xenopodis]